MKYVYFYNTGIKELGTLGIGACEDKITDLFFEYEMENVKKNKNYIIKETPLIKKAAFQLFEYLNGKRKEFDLPLLKNGTDFQISVWNELLKIPYGETISYSDEAKIIGKDKAVRAVGSANGKNSIPIIIPCHRVVSKDGSLGGYSGGEGGNKGIEIKKYLLELEKKF